MEDKFDTHSENLDAPPTATMKSLGIMGHFRKLHKQIFHQSVDRLCDPMRTSGFQAVMQKTIQKQ